MSKILPLLIILCTCFLLIRQLNSSFVTLSLSANTTNGDLLHKLNLVRQALYNITPSMTITITAAHPNCVQAQCKFICLHGRSGEIDKDINRISEINHEPCQTIEELRLYNYEFPNQTISRGFLGEYEKRITYLHIASSNVTRVEPGAFADGKFQKLAFENLFLEELDKSFFDGVTAKFQNLIVIQRNKPLKSVSSNFFDHIKYQIRYLVMQVGLQCVRNLTASDNLLNNLYYVDFSFNNFSNQFQQNTFSKLSMVEHLDLSNSEISYLPNYIFGELMGTLEYLNLKYNKLTTISSMVFGYRAIPDYVEIVLEHNPWNCTCDLQRQFYKIYVVDMPKLFCAAPEIYDEWSVFDARLCPPDVDGDDEAKIDVVTKTTPGIHMPTQPPTSMLPPFMASTTSQPLNESTTVSHTGTTTEHAVSAPPVHPPYFPPMPPETNTPSDNSTIQLQCHKPANPLDINRQTIRKPSLGFAVTYKPTLRVDVLVEPGQQIDAYGLIWFSRVTKQYYLMEINYNDFGLGCYGNIAQTTTVDQLLPNVAYTFCLVLKNQLTVSPFSCQSVLVAGNLNVQYNAWLTRGMRPTGITLVVFGTVMFAFVGILLAFMVLKHKPTLLVGSKRVTTTRANSGEIVVLPKSRTIENLQLKEEMLAKRNSRSTVSCLQRRDSTGSTVSYQSYINTNLYEVIPAYLRFSNASSGSGNTAIYDVDDAPMDDDYMAPTSGYLRPFQSRDSSAHLVSYAEIPHRTKRISNDPLPAVPKDDGPLSVSSLYEYVQQEERNVRGAATSWDSQL